MPRMSVVVPAHNEERTIARLLTTLCAQDRAEELEIVVACNGCTDRTADAARAVSDRIRVIEIETASKIAALNAGDAATDLFPRAYVDADTEVSAAALLALVEPLSEPGVVLTAAPQMVVVTDGAGLLSRMFHAVWRRTPYVQAGPIGCGVYALSAAARARFEDFPPVIADDLYVERLAGEDNRYIDRTHTFTFHAPRTLDGLLARLTRATLGNLQLETVYGMTSGTGTPGSLIADIARRPWLWPSFVAYAAIRTVAGRRARRRLAAGEFSWGRDDTTR